MKKKQKFVMKSLSKKEQVKTLGGYAPLPKNPLEQTDPLKTVTTIPNIKDTIICR